MEELDYWRLCEELNVVQAALLVVEANPVHEEWLKNWDADNRPKGYDAAKTAICTGLKITTNTFNSLHAMKPKIWKLH